tara:strand:- start:1272 stop:1826 length:555 start_codon:yes stop_codon:yes gene_type:complete
MSEFSIKGKHNGTPVDIKSTEDGELQVRSINETLIEHASSQGLAYCWSSSDSDIDAGDTRLFIKNTSDKFLVFDYAIINFGNVACKYDFGIGSATTTPAGGTEITATNLNGTINIAESYVSRDDETAVVDATRMFTACGTTTGDTLVRLSGIILGKNQYLQINQETESTSGRVNVFGRFETEIV